MDVMKPKAEPKTTYNDVIRLAKLLELNHIRERFVSIDIKI
jgi:hypothetical protein